MANLSAAYNDRRHCNVKVVMVWQGGSSLTLVEPGAVGENPSAEQMKQLLGPWLDSNDTLHLRASDLRFA